MKRLARPQPQSTMSEEITLDTMHMESFTYRPWPWSATGRKIDSEMGVGKNWSRDSAERWMKFCRNFSDSRWHFSMSMVMG